MEDGSKWVRKVIPPSLAAQSLRYADHQDAEELTSRVSDALGAGAPPTIRRGDEVWMPFVKGEHPYEQFGSDWDPTFDQKIAAYTESDHGIRIGILDRIVENGDRGIDNWIITDRGAIPIDHGNATFGHPPNKMLSPFGEKAEFFRLSRLTQDQWNTMQRNLEALKPVFEAKGRSVWYWNMMDNFEDLRKPFRSFNY